MTAVPGTGRIDVETALSRLEAAGYRGDMIVEENRVRSDAELADFAEGAAESVKRFRTRYPGLFR